jgi:hypothetical protein
VKLEVGAMMTLTKAQGEEISGIYTHFRSKQEQRVMKAYQEAQKKNNDADAFHQSSVASRKSFNLNHVDYEEKFHFNFFIPSTYFDTACRRTTSTHLSSLELVERFAFSQVFPEQLVTPSFF